MDKRQMIIEKMQGLTDKGHYNSSSIIIGAVSAVNGIDTIDVDVDDVTYHDVQLQAIEQGSGNSLLMIPAKGSKVLIGSIENGTAYVLLHADKLDAVKSKIGNCELEQVKDGVLIKVGGNTLGALLDDLLSALSQLTVTTGVGPSGVPINVADLISIQTKLKTILK